MTAPATARRTDPLPAATADPATREAILASTREMLGWLEENPGIPLGTWGHEWLVGVGREGVDAAASLMGVTAEHSASAHRAVKRFGPVAYVAYAANLDVTP